MKGAVEGVARLDGTLSPSSPLSLRLSELMPWQQEEVRAAFLSLLPDDFLVHGQQQQRHEGAIC